MNLGEGAGRAGEEMACEADDGGMEGGGSGGPNDRSHHRYVTSVKVTDCSED